MPSKQSKSLILAIHIDSAEINLAAGYVDNGVVNLLAIQRSTLEGISKGNITNSENFTASFCIAVQNFLDQECKVVNLDKIKELKLDVDDHNRLVFKKITFNLLVSDANSSASFIQSNFIKDILRQRFFQGSLQAIDGVNLFTCTADTAVTRLLVESNQDIPYSINIHFGRYSTGINFICDSKTTRISSKSIEIGFNDILIYLNNNHQINLDRSATIEEIYPYLKHYHFYTTGRSNIRTLFIRNRYELISTLDEIFISTVQYIVQQLYYKFCQLDNEGLRYKKGFENKVKINIMGYMADFDSIQDCVALVFSKKLQLDREIYHKNKEQDYEHSQSSYGLNPTTGTYSYNNIPQVTSNLREIIYSQVNQETLLKAYCLQVYSKINYLLDVCAGPAYNLPNFKIELDKFAGAIGLIYNFDLIQLTTPIKQDKSVMGFIKNLFKFQ